MAAAGCAADAKDGEVAGSNHSLETSSTNQATKLNVTCTLDMGTENPDGTIKRESLAPGGAVTKEVVISKADGQLPMTKIAFEAKSPDGVISFSAHASASAFGSSFLPVLSLSASLVAKDILFRSSNAFLEQGELDNKDWHDEQSLDFSAGLKPDGTVFRAYNAACKMTVAP